MEKPSGTITFSTHRTDQSDKIIRRIADNFETLHPGTEIKIVAQGNPEIESAFAANELADVTQVNIFSRISRDSYPLYFAPIDDLGFTQTNLCFFDGGTGPDGHLYAVTNCINYDGFIYNRKLFREAGIESVPRTKTAFFEACAKLKAAGFTPVGLNLSARWTTRWYCEHAYASAVHGVPNYLNTIADSDALFPPGGGLREGLDFLRKILQDGFAEPDPMTTSWDDFVTVMARGEVAMTYLGTWFPPQLEARGMEMEEIGMFPLPDSIALVSMFDTWYAISKKTANLPLSKAFFSYLFREGHFALDLGIIPPGRGAQVDYPFLQELLGYGLPVLEGEGDSIRYQNRYAASGIELYDIAQEYAISTDPEKVIEKANDLWRNTR